MERLTETPMDGALWGTGVYADLESQSPGITGITTEFREFPQGAIDYNAFYSAHARWLYESDNMKRLNHYTLVNEGMKPAGIPPSWPSIWFNRALDLASDSNDRMIVHRQNSPLPHFNPEHYAHIRLNEQRLSQNHRDYARDNVNTILEYLNTYSNLMTRIQETHGIQLAFAPLILQSAKQTARMSVASPLLFAHEQTYYTIGIYGFDDWFTRSGFSYTAMFDTAAFLNYTLESDLDEPRVRHHRFHKWTHLASHGIAILPGDSGLLLNHDYAIHPACLVHRGFNAFPTHPHLTRVPFYNDVVTHVSLIRHPNDAHAQQPLTLTTPDTFHSKLPAFLSLGCQLLSMAAMCVNTGRGSNRPRWTTTPMNRWNMIHTMAIAPFIISRMKGAL